jgi:hypothetical protein
VENSSQMTQIRLGVRASILFRPPANNERWHNVITESLLRVSTITCFTARAQLLHFTLAWILRDRNTRRGIDKKFLSWVGHVAAPRGAAIHADCDAILIKSLLLVVSLRGACCKHTLEQPWLQRPRRIYIYWCRGAQLHSRARMHFVLAPRCVHPGAVC